MKNNSYHIFFNNLANPLKIEIIGSLKKTSKSVKELVKELNVEQSKVSHALSALKKCSLFIRDVIKTSKATPKMKEFIKKRYSPFGIQRLFKTSEMFIIKDNDKIICTGKLSKNTNEIGMIYVNSNFQRKKNGTKMMQFLESLAKKKKKKETYVHALYPAIGFYKKLGYKLIKCNFVCRLLL